MRALLFGLGRYWQGAVANATILYHASGGTLVMGGTISLLCAMGAMSVAMWRQSKRSARELLTLDFTQDQPTGTLGRSRTIGLALSAASLVLALLIILYARVAEVGESMIPLFAAGSL